MKNWKTTQYNFSRDYWLFIIDYWLSACFFFFLSKNTLHAFFFIHTCYWSTRYWFTNYFSCRKTISCASDFKSYMFALYHSISLPISVLSHLRFILWSPPRSSLFNLPRVQLYQNVVKYIRFEVIYHPLLNTFWIYWMLI